MPSAIPTALLVLSLLAQSKARTVQPTPMECGDDIRSVDLSPESDGRMWEICTQTDVPVTFFFDPALPAGTRVDMSPGNRFFVSQGPQLLSFLPRSSFALGERTTLTVYFGDGLVPSRASFILIGQAAHPVAPVRVTRHPRLNEQALERATARPDEREQAGGLRGLMDTGIMDMRGVRTQNLSRQVAPIEGSALTPNRVRSFRAMLRIAVAVEFMFLDEEPWTIEGSSLVGANGEELQALSPWHTGQIKRSGHVMLEFEATPKQARGNYTLNIWDSAGRVAAIGNITFPELGPAE